MADPQATTDRAASLRPRFSEQEGRLLLAAIYHMKRESPHDLDWYRLYEKLDKYWGDRT